MSASAAPMSAASRRRISPRPSNSLPGNSGGPVVDAAGVLVGVVVKGASNPENGFRYDVDPRKKDDWQSFLVPCQAVLRIMERSGLR